MEQTIYLTKKGLIELQDELDYLRTTKRDEVIIQLQEARAMGDLSENADYDAARDEQAKVEGRIKEIERMLENYEIISDNTDKDKVSIGNVVVLKDLEFGDIEEYRIVGIQEADPNDHRISNESPIAVAILGHKVGDTCSVAAPVGDYKVEIMEIK